MNWKAEQQKSWNLNNKDKIEGEKTVNRASVTCGTVIRNLTLVLLESQKETREGTPEQLKIFSVKGPNTERKDKLQVERKYLKKDYYLGYIKNSQNSTVKKQSK